MPIIDDIRVGQARDRRRKLSDEDKAEIRRLYEVEEMGIREIARLYEDKVCRRTVQFVLFPHRLKQVNFKGHWKKYYSKEKRKREMRKFRDHLLEIRNQSNG